MSKSRDSTPDEARVWGYFIAHLKLCPVCKGDEPCKRAKELHENWKRRYGDG